MIPAWVSDWVGIPHLRRGRGLDGCDCLGLYILLNKARLGVEIPDPHCSVSQAIRRDAAKQNRPLYDEVISPQEGDAILIRARGFPLHVGYCIDKTFMIHNEDNRASAVERWNGTKWQNRVLGVYRYAGRREQG